MGSDCGVFWWDSEKKLNVVMAAVVMLQLMVACGGMRVLELSGCEDLPFGSASLFSFIFDTYK